jgi:hypothetical protein
MDRARSVLIYTRLIESNLGIIQKLTDIPQSARYSFDAYIRYDLAATIADANSSFLNILSVLDPAAARLPRGEVLSGDDYRLTARGIAERIPVDLQLNTDPDGRISSAFSSVFSTAGFRIGGGSPRYRLIVQIAFNDVAFPRTPINLSAMWLTPN